MPDSIPFSLPLFHQDQFDAESEERHTLWGQPGKVKFLYRLTRGNMGTATWGPTRMRSPWPTRPARRRPLLHEFDAGKRYRD